MSILVNKNMRVITQGMIGDTGTIQTETTRPVDQQRGNPYFTHNLCKCGDLR
jgi:succinyl-CoA synthetase alpha subunit